jgi:hypothetical protein
MSTTGRIPLTVSVGFHLSFADGRYGWTRTTAGTVMTSSCGQSSLGELKARLPGGAFTTSLRHERGACSTHFDVIFVEQPGAVEKKKHPFLLIRGTFTQLRDLLEITGRYLFRVKGIVRRTLNAHLLLIGHSKIAVT